MVTQFETRPLYSDESLEFPARDGEEHRWLCKIYNTLSTDKEKEEFFAKHGARWTEFARLHYFDLVRYTIVHNLLLGKSTFGMILNMAH
jgi:hypothetical protein